jgi:hypothetical protein
MICSPVLVLNVDHRIIVSGRSSQEVYYYRFLQNFIQICRYVFRRDLRMITFYGLASFVDEEFGEVPSNRVFAFVVSQFITKPLIQWCCRVTIHIKLGKHREVHLVFTGSEFKNFLIAAGFLGTKLVARETQYRDLTAFVQSTQTCVLRG